jgi:hypothetical protein
MDEVEKYKYCCQTTGTALTLAVVAQGRIQATCFGQLTGHPQVPYEMHCNTASVFVRVFFIIRLLLLLLVLFILLLVLFIELLKFLMLVWAVVV